MDSERTDWISQYGVVRKKKRGILGFIKAVLLRRSERKVRDVNDLDASDCIRRYNLVFGIDSDNPGAAVRRVRLPVSESMPKTVVDFEPSESGNRPAVETEYCFVPSTPAAVPTSSLAAESMSVNPFPFDAAEEEQEEEDPYNDYIHDKYSDEPAAESVEEDVPSESSVTEEESVSEQIPLEETQETAEETATELYDYFTDLEMDSAELSDVRVEDLGHAECAPAETVQTLIDGLTFDESDASVSAEPVLVRQDLLDIQFEDEPVEDVASEIAEAAAEAEALRTYVESAPAAEVPEASEPVQLIEAPTEYAALCAPADVPALGAPAEEPAVAIEASEEVPMLAASEPAVAVCAPAETVSLPAPAQGPVKETYDSVEEEIEAYIYGMQDPVPASEPAEESVEDIDVGIDMFDEYMELQDAVEAEASMIEDVPVIEEKVEASVEEPVIEEIPVAEEPVTEVPAEAVPETIEPIVETITEAPVAEEPVEVIPLEEILGTYEGPVTEVPAEAVPETIEPIVETITEVPVAEAPAEHVCEVPVVEIPIISEMSADEFAVPAAFIPSSGISFRFGSSPMMRQSSGVRFVFGTTSERPRRWRI